MYGGDWLLQGINTRPDCRQPETTDREGSQGKTRLQIQEELGISRATYYRLAK